MGDKTGIEWTDATWNPIRGCSRVSDGCRNCYAETVANRFKGPGLPYEGLIAKGGQWNGKIRIVEHLIDQPLRWRRPRRIFVNSMSDLFHENVPDELIDKVFAVMALCPQHTFQVLTKRPNRMLEYCKSLGKHRSVDRVSIASAQLQADGLFSYTHTSGGWCLPNVWLGVSVEDQATAEERIPLLLATPAAVRWISAEPLLGPLDLDLSRCETHDRDFITDDEHCGECLADGWSGDMPTGHWLDPLNGGLDWVVVGGESGSGARPMHPEWPRYLRDQCVNAGVPFLFKQWGDWGDEESIERTGTAWCGWWELYPEDGGAPRKTWTRVWPEVTHEVFKVGKKHAGRYLGDRTWDEYPPAHNLSRELRK
ncbi:phage Gp37/Gp68 family protein [Spongiibacter sp. KMU-166]|uniref:Phage Gp37/Gp68 family protein n=1 Tax=Spongiibacter thalassae TaxID=2721624 RepID=A0ABX1GEM6_9GAMM|nr:phage Gp37/Gp68 family protein [Spongiibacter thalassae]NKI17400.1 phage Gp37/Gp68 family protein [Spongiibacter thalassae]